MSELSVRGLAVRLAGRTIVADLDLSAAAGQVVGLLGPNGSGKSSVLRVVYRALRSSAGAIWLGGDDLASLPRQEAARRVGALAQDTAGDFDFSVGEIVAMGRTPHLPRGARLGEADLEICRQALAAMDALHLWERGVVGLSGGERQRVMIARAIAQCPQLLVLDEPTNHLDPAHQARLAAFLRATTATTLLVLHDVNLAAAVCDRLYFLRGGALVASGAPSEVITTDVLGRVFDISPAVVTHPVSGLPQVLPTFEQKVRHP